MRYWRPELLIRIAFIPAASATFSGLVSTWQSSISRPEPVSRTNIEYRFLMTAVPFQARPRPRCRRQDGKNTCCTISYRDRAEACNLRRDWINKGVGDVFISQARAQAPRGSWLFRSAMFPVPRRHARTIFPADTRPLRSSTGLLLRLHL